jgi:hypothetical protein
MLQEGHAEHVHGRDVVVGFVETLGALTPPRLCLASRCSRAAVWSTARSGSTRWTCPRSCSRGHHLPVASAWSDAPTRTGEIRLECRAQFETKCASLDGGPMPRYRIPERNAQCRRRDSNPRHADYDRHAGAWVSLCKAESSPASSGNPGLFLPSRGPSSGPGLGPAASESRGSSAQRSRATTTCSSGSTATSALNPQ